MDTSHTIRGIHLGQDRYKRRYFVLPNAGGIYIEGMESGFFDENVTHKTKEEHEERKEHLHNLLTSLKSPTSLTTNTNTSTPNAAVDSATLTSITPNELVKSPPHDEMKKENTTKTFSDNNTNPSMGAPWFSLHRKGHCESYKMSASLREPLYDRKHTLIVAPNVRQLCDDRNFLESIYSSSFPTLGAQKSLLPISRYPLSKEHIHKNMLLGKFTVRCKKKIIL